MEETTIVAELTALTNELNRYLKNVKSPDLFLIKHWYDLAFVGTFGHGYVRQKNVMGLSANDKIYEELVARQPDDAIQLIEELQMMLNLLKKGLEREEAKSVMINRYQRRTVRTLF